MHKSHFLSPIRITLPVVLEHIELPVEVKPVSWRDFLKDPESAEYGFTFIKRDYYGPFDPWKLRQEFLLCPVEEWESFVEWTGLLGTYRISQNDFAEWQRLIRKALILHPREWRKLETEFDKKKVRMLFEPLPITFIWDSDAPEAKIRTAKTLRVIIATIQLDVLRGTQFKVCARTDCANPPFKAEARQKIYCSPECAHLVAVRNSRARAASRGAGRRTRNRRKERS